MTHMDRGAFLAALAQSKADPACARPRVENADISGADLSGLDLEWIELCGVNAEGCDFSGGSMANGKFTDTKFRSSSFKNLDLGGADMRGCDLTGCDARGANFYCAWLEGAKLDGIIDDESTRYFRLRCPEKGAFIAYKKCLWDRIVMLLVPADAKRVSATNNACRCNKAKVLTITSFDFTERFTEATSIVTDNFTYRVGQVVTPDRFTEDRWCESTYGIHFWMSREEAMNY